MKTSFYISENRISELKTFIRNHLPSVRFEHNPMKLGDKFHVSLTMDVEDGNKLNELQNKWYEEDNPPKPKKKSFWRFFK